MKTMSKQRYWLLTIPAHLYVPFLHRPVKYVRGQLERGGDTGYLHWQLLIIFNGPQRLSFVKSIYGDQCHAEPSRSRAADEYVWKDDTSIQGTRFELGTRGAPGKTERDWIAIRDSARRGDFLDVPADVYVRNYASLKRIAQDHMEPVAMERI